MPESARERLKREAKEAPQPKTKETSQEEIKLAALQALQKCVEVLGPKQATRCLGQVFLDRAVNHKTVYSPIYRKASTEMFHISFGLPDQLDQ